MDRSIDLTPFKKSKFRQSFSLDENDFAYISEKGVATIRDHAFEFVLQRLAPGLIPNDGKQTPFKGHPVFIAQHATATCCRGCLEKWHKIPKGMPLNSDQIEYVTKVIMLRIETWNNEFSQPIS